MNISVFLSYPKPYNNNQKTFIESVMRDLNERGLDPRTLGITDYDIVEPLAAIRKILMDCNGVLVIAFRRTVIKKREDKTWYRNAKRNFKRMDYECFLPNRTRYGVSIGTSSNDFERKWRNRRWSA